MEISSKSKAIVYVHLGTNPTPTLLHFSKLAKEYSNEMRLFLITDNPKIFEDFPGKVIHYVEKHKHIAIRTLENKFPHYKNISGGYWIKTIERLFALQAINEELNDDEPLIHFESDVMSLITNEIYEIVVENIKEVAYPRFSQNAGIASVFYSPSVSKLMIFLENLNDIIQASKVWLTDMDLLGLSLERKKSLELPSFFPITNKLIHSTGFEIIFDGAAIGQYLLGRDPVHTGGRAISGYLNPNFTFHLDKAMWNITCSRDSEECLLLVQDKVNPPMIIANLHIHSKRLLGNLSESSEDWIDIIESANNTRPPILGEYQIDLIHSTSVHLQDRITWVKQKGLISVLKRKFKSVLLRDNG